MELVFASNNKNKILEIQQLVGAQFPLKSLKEIGCEDDLPETSDTIEGNASQKANFIYRNYQLACFADDTGLEIEVLKGAPGVLSAHYAGPERDNEKNINKVLTEMEYQANRNAHFKTIISFIIEGQEFLFEGIVEGKIIHERRGSKGFGYDSIFVPNGGNKTFAEMDMDEKNKISHRAIAFKKLARYLKSLPNAS